MAEAYFNSKQLKDTQAISSGTVADKHSEANKDNFVIVQSVLENHGLGKYTKPHWDQLTKERLNDCDFVVFLNQRVADECNKLFGLPIKYTVWDVQDFDEINSIPNTEPEFREYAEKTFQVIRKRVDQAIKNSEIGF
jgi:protein-tyrosine-phosphatase